MAYRLYRCGLFITQFPSTVGKPAGVAFASPQATFEHVAGGRGDYRRKTCWRHLYLPLPAAVATLEGFC